jgi:thiol-disulfide isomerase/thioredoxin
MISSKKNSRETIFLFCFGMFLVFVSAQIRAHEDPWKGLSVNRLSGHSPPDFTLPTLDGGSITLSDLKGKVVLINFWTTWCPPCREEMPSLERLYRHFKYEDFTLLAVDIMENPETIKTFVKEFNLSFPILLDKTGDVSVKYAANAIPTTYIIDKEGKTAGKAIGPRKWDGDHAKDLIMELLRE